MLEEAIKVEKWDKIFGQTLFFRTSGCNSVSLSLSASLFPNLDLHC